MATSLPIPTDFVASYNGFTFDPAHSLTTGLSVTPMPDETGRTVAYNKVYLKLKTEVIGQPTDPTILQARQKLTKYGGVLIYGGRGIGPLTINTGRVKDILFGPKPRVLSLKPLGYKNSCEIEWEVDVHIPECSDARYSLGILSLSYRMEFKLTRGGRVDQMVSGMLKIPNNRVLPGSENVIDSPDKYRAQIAPPVPFWHHREWQGWRLSPDRTSVDFGWTDHEFGENVFPPGITHATASHSADQSVDGINFIIGKCTLRARYTLDASADRSLAMAAFLRLIDRRAKSRDRLPGRNGKPLRLIIMRFSASEPEIYGQDRECDFTCHYDILNTSLATLLRDTGLWEPLGDDWGEWYQSVISSSQSPYGFSRVTFTPYSDQIVDLCQANPGGLKPIRAGRVIPQGQIQTLSLPAIEESGSWRKYVNALYVESDSGIVQIRALASKTLPKPKKSPTPAELKSGTFPTTKEIAPPPRPVIADQGGYQSLAGAIADKLGQRPAEGRGGNGSSAGSGKGNPPPPDAVQNKTPPGPGDTPTQRRAVPLTVLYLIGEAVRVGFEIPVPTIGDVDGITPEGDNRLDMGEGFITGIVGATATNVPIYGAKWKLRYVLPSPPSGPIRPPDPSTWLGRRLG